MMEMLNSLSTVALDMAQPTMLISSAGFLVFAAAAVALVVAIVFIIKARRKK